jgi:UDP-galactopyranose mutase
MFDWLVVGAGFAGSVLAERLASVRGERVAVIDRRNHVGGNAYDRLDAAGVLIHQYGPHIFHTNSRSVFDYLSRFTAWRPYKHRVLAEVSSPLTGQPMRVPMPINLDTINRLYGLSMTEAEVEGWLAARAEAVPEIRTSEDVVVSRLGRELYELFFRGYTRKQWGLDPSELDRSVTARVPTRSNRDDCYFSDAYQQMPRNGYTAMLRRMLSHPNITLQLNMSWSEARHRLPFRRIIWTGPVDEFFGFRHGKLPYRSLTFEHKTLDQEWAQPTAVLNYPAEAVPWTRITEYKHMTGQSHPRTSVTYEYPAAEGDPYYPIPRPENQTLYKRYEALADATSDAWFVGRLATYRYYNMDQVVGQALATFARIDASVPPRAANDGTAASALATAAG